MESQQEQQWREDPQNWKWGMFYYNPADRRIFPPKRIPWMGWTVNFASAKSVWFFVAMMALAVFIAYMFDSSHS